MEYLKVVRNHQFPNGKVMVANELVTRNEATKRWGLAERDLESMPKVSPIYDFNGNMVKYI